MKPIQITFISLIFLILGCEKENNQELKTLDDSATFIWRDSVELTCSLDTISAIEKLYKIWKQNEPDHYSYRIERQCYCEYFPLQIEIRNGAVDTMYLYDQEVYKYYQENSPSSLEWFMEEVAPRQHMDSLFAILEKGRKMNPYEHQSSFHPEYGFPCSFWFDPNKDFVDEEYGSSLTLFIIADK